MPCHTCSFRRVVIRGTAASLPGDTVMASPVDKQPGISLASSLAAALYVKHLSPLTAILHLGPLGNMPLIWGPCRHPLFNMAAGENFSNSFCLSIQQAYHKSVSLIYNQVLSCPVKYPFCLCSLSDHESFIFILAKTWCRSSSCLFHSA